MGYVKHCLVDIITDFHSQIDISWTEMELIAYFNQVENLYLDYIMDIILSVKRFCEIYIYPRDYAIYFQTYLITVRYGTCPK